MSAHSPDLIDALVGGRYQVERKLGEGGMGEVYVATDQRTKSEVVIKSPWPGMLLDDPSLKSRFVREVRTMSRLDHPHVVKVYDVLEHNGRPVAVMQFLKGGNLDANPQIPLQKWLLAVADALDYLHANKFVHRDVKPANIFFDVQGTPYLGDFGIVKSLDASRTLSFGNLSQTGMALGTPKYMSPEAIEGKPVDARSDQYSLAIIVYERLSGRMPFDADTPAHMFAAHLKDEPRRLSELDRRFGDEISHVLQRALCKTAEDRFATCGEFAHHVLSSLEPSVADEWECPAAATHAAGANISGESGDGSATASQPESRREDGDVRSGRRTLSWWCVGLVAVVGVVWLGMLFRGGNLRDEHREIATVDAVNERAERPSRGDREGDSRSVETHTVQKPPARDWIRALSQESSEKQTLVLSRMAALESRLLRASVSATKEEFGREFVGVLQLIGQPLGEPEELISVSIRGDGAKLTLDPGQSIGCDIVNHGGKSSDGDLATQVEIECLPGAVLAVAVGSGVGSGGLISLESRDDGKSVLLRADGPVIYRNNVPSFFCLSVKSEWTEKNHAKELREYEAALRRAKDGLSRVIRDARAAMESEQLPPPLGFVVGCSDEWLPWLKRLAGTGADIYFIPLGGEYRQHRAGVSDEFIDAFLEVRSRRAMLDCAAIRQFGHRLTRLEGLGLYIPPGDSIPDLKHLTNLRELVILSGDSKEDETSHQVRLDPLTKLANLKALTISAAHCERVSGLGNLDRLQFLTIVSNEPPTLEGVEKLQRLMYLAAKFPLNTDFRFTHKMPYLRTLSIANLDAQHDIRPLTQLPNLRWLATDRVEEKAGQLSNMAAFRSARLDVEIIEYDPGMCLGSGWLILLVAGAALGAWWIRFRFRGRGVMARGNDS